MPRHATSGAAGAGGGRAARQVGSHRRRWHVVLLFLGTALLTSYVVTQTSSMRTVSRESTSEPSSPSPSSSSLSAAQSTRGVQEAGLSLGHPTPVPTPYDPQRAKERRDEERRQRLLARDREQWAKANASVINAPTRGPTSQLDRFGHCRMSLRCAATLMREASTVYYGVGGPTDVHTLQPFPQKTWTPHAGGSAAAISPSERIRLVLLAQLSPLLSPACHAETVMVSVGAPSSPEFIHGWLSLFGGSCVNFAFFEPNSLKAQSIRKIVSQSKKITAEKYELRRKVDVVEAALVSPELHGLKTNTADDTSLEILLLRRQKEGGNLNRTSTGDLQWQWGFLSNHYGTGVRLTNLRRHLLSRTDTLNPKVRASGRISVLSLQTEGLDTLTLRTSVRGSLTRKRMDALIFGLGMNMVPYLSLEGGPPAETPNEESEKKQALTRTPQQTKPLTRALGPTPRPPPAPLKKDTRQMARHINATFSLLKQCDYRSFFVYFLPHDQLPVAGGGGSTASTTEEERKGEAETEADLFPLLAGRGTSTSTGIGRPLMGQLVLVEVTDPYVFAQWSFLKPLPPSETEKGRERVAADGQPDPSGGPVLPYHHAVWAPNRTLVGENFTFANFPKRELLSFRTVFALPKASRMGEQEASFTPTALPSSNSSGLAFKQET